jgi:hypothetical protein
MSYILFRVIRKHQKYICITNNFKNVLKIIIYLLLFNYNLFSFFILILLISHQLKSF